MTWQQERVRQAAREYRCRCESMLQNKRVVVMIQRGRVQGREREEAATKEKGSDERCGSTGEARTLPLFSKFSNLNDTGLIYRHTLDRISGHCQNPSSFNVCSLISVIPHSRSVDSVVVGVVNRGSPVRGFKAFLFDVAIPHLEVCGTLARGSCGCRLSLPCLTLAES
jgi:hypothetical protein